MTIQSMIELFELVQDHYNTPYFPEEEITMFLNSGQKKIFNDLVFNGDSQAEPSVIGGIKYTGKFEMDIQKQNILLNCTILDQAVTAAAGLLTVAAIETASSRTVALITKVNIASSGAAVDIVRQAEYDEYKANYFTNTSRTLGRFGNGGILVDGIANGGLKVSFLAEPRLMDLTTPVQPDLVGVHEMIVAEALRIAGYAVSDQMLMNIKL